MGYIVTHKSDVSKTFGERETRYQTKGYVSVEEAFKTI